MVLPIFPIFSHSLPTQEDKVFAFIQDTVGKQLVSVVSEARNYCYKCFDGTVGTIDLDFVNNCALRK